jgi:hypothetical protein
MPEFISTLLIKKVLRNPAVPLAMQPTKALIRINFAPVSLLEIPEKSFLRIKATDTDEPTAAV